MDLKIIQLCSCLLISTLFVSSLALTEDITQAKTPVQIVAEKLHGKGYVVEQTLEPFIVSAEGRKNLTLLVQQLDSDEEGSGPICFLCQLLVGLLEQVSYNRTWIVLSPALKTACRVALPMIDETIRADELCGGIIDHQGRAIYDILKEDATTPYGFCEHLNGCIPPRPSSQQKEIDELNDGVRRRFLEIFKSLGNHGNGYTFDEKPNIENDFTSSKDSETRKKFEAILKTFSADSQIKLEETQMDDSYNKSDLIKIVQLADIHIEDEYAEGSATDCGLPVCCKERFNGTGSAGPWGDYQCNIPLKTMHLFLEKAGELNPDFIIYSGDTPPHTVWEESFNSQLDCSKTLVNAMQETLGSYTIFPNIGNHELFPTNLYHTARLSGIGQSDTLRMNGELTSLWSDLAGFEQEQKDTMQEGGYYSMLIREGLRVISFNTNYWYTFNFYNVLNQNRPDFLNMKQFIEDKLDDARNNGEKVIMVGHHPPGNGDIIVKTARWFTDLVAEYNDVIVLHVGGHTHKDEFRMIRDYETNEAKGVVLLAPSVTSRTNKNPSLRVLFLHPESYELVDYEQYHFDLLETFANRTEPDIKLVYSAREEYDMDDLSPSSWNSLVRRMWRDYYLTAKHMDNYNTRALDDPIFDCDSLCLAEYICKMSSSTFDQRLACTESGPTAPRPSQPPVTPTISKATDLHKNTIFFIIVAIISCILKI